MYFLDNTGSTNKNCYLILWGMEVVEQRKLDHMCFRFLVAGHTRFELDCLFAHIADIFIAEELLGVCQQFSTATIENGSNVFEWRNMLMKKFSELPGVRKLHDFFVVCSGDSTVAMKVRAKCHVRVLLDSPLHIVGCLQSATPVGCYADHPWSWPSKMMDHMRQMYSRYIPPGQWPITLQSNVSDPPRNQILLSCK